MPVTRRRFLVSLGLAVAAGTVVAWLGRDAARRWLVVTSPGRGRPGRLRDSTEHVLRAATVTLLDDRIEPEHYADFFRWRAEHVPGSRALYERFEAAVDRAARRAGHAGFRAAPLAVRRRILDTMRPARGGLRLRRAFLARDEARFARHVVREVFRRFARTDAWLRAGYDSWPGMPRALASLRAAGPPA